MAFTATNVNVGTTAVAIFTAGAAETPNIWISVPSDKLIYIGGSGVTIETGLPMRGTFQATLAATEAIFGITDELTVPVRVLEQV